MSQTARMSVSTLFLTLLISIVYASPARAEGFISPFIGYNFGGDSGCPSISNCEDKNLNWGIGVGAVGGLVLSYRINNLPSGAAIVLTLGAIFLLAWLFSPRYGVLRRLLHPGHFHEESLARWPEKAGHE